MPLTLRILFIATLIISIFTTSSIAQDTIITVKNEQITVSEYSVQDETITYKNYTNPNGPYYTLPLTYIQAIKSNGGIHSIADKTYQEFSSNKKRMDSLTQAANLSTFQEKTPIYTNYYLGDNNKSILIGIGAGVSHGDYGIRLQYKGINKGGLGLQLGLGYSYSEDQGRIIGSIGGKFYPTKWLYLNGQLGFVDARYVAVDTGHFSYPTFENQFKRRFGVSILAGTDITLYNNLGLNLAIGICRVTFYPNTWKKVFDAGLYYKFNL